MKNLEMLAHVAHGLGELKDKVVFVGGATIELYITDPTAPQVRPTEDVDCVAELVSRSDYYQLEEKLRGLGFQHSTDAGAPICRWNYKGVRVDVMPTEGKILTFKNRWYPEGFSNSRPATLPEGMNIRIFSIPYLLASKLEAFEDRGGGDFATSRDIEDVVAVLDGAPDAAEAIRTAPGPVKSYLRDKFNRLLTEELFLEALPGHLPSAAGSTERAARVESLLREMVSAS
ncbi:MAG TPA: hypothetical protein DCM05_12805 [Elusimicrobia bacterium]|nr:hypothetical protein [Elusimicrobiota bacterium]